jgi:16S rRNA (guanine527-N7)-methyltransferase
MNLVQRGSVKMIMNRHIEDCEQICRYLNKEDVIIDVGSGAGLPGIVLSIYNFQSVILCEKSYKKSVFLHEARSKLGLNFAIYNGNVYNFSARQFLIQDIRCDNVILCDALQGCILVSRAFGSLAKLLDIMCKITALKGIFHKGKKYMIEIAEAQMYFEFDYNVKQSATNINGVVIILFNCRRK